MSSQSSSHQPELLVFFIIMIELVATMTSPALLKLMLECQEQGSIHYLIFLLNLGSILSLVIQETKIFASPVTLIKPSECWKT